MSDKLQIPPEWLKLAGEGDETAFTGLMQRVLPLLEVITGKIVRSPDAVRDILQETMIRIWVNRDKLPELEKPLPWMKRVALNETFTWLSKRAQHNKLFLPLETDIPLQADAADLVSLRETQEILRQAIDELSPQRKMIYQMSRVQGMKSPEIADALNLSHGYVKNALTTALAFLRERLAAAGKLTMSFFL